MPREIHPRNDGKSNLLSNDDSINRIVTQNKSLALRIYEWIKTAIKKMTGKVDTKSEEYRFLRKAEKLYANAIKNSIGGVSLADVALDKMFETYKELADDERNARKQPTKPKTAEARYSLEKYTQHEIDNWANSKQIVLYESSKQFSEFIDDALNGKNLGKKIVFGKLSAEAAKKIFDATGINVEGYNLSLSAGEIRKIMLYSHGDAQYENLRGQEKITKEDIMLIPEIVSGAERVVRSETDYKGRPALIFEKNINGRKRAVAYESKRSHDLIVQSMYVWKENKKSLSIVEDVKSPSFTPEATDGTALVSGVNRTPTGTSIRNSAEKRNAFSEKTSETAQNGGGIGKNTQESPLRFSIVEGNKDLVAITSLLVLCDKKQFFCSSYCFVFRSMGNIPEASPMPTTFWLVSK